LPLLLLWTLQHAFAYQILMLILKRLLSWKETGSRAARDAMSSAYFLGSFRALLAGR
jgi:hypothetical protein